MTADMTVFLVQKNRNEAKSIPPPAALGLVPVKAATRLLTSVAIALTFTMKTKEKGHLLVSLFFWLPLLDLNQRQRG